MSGKSARPFAEFEQRQREYEEANRDNPVWGFTHWGADSPLSYSQRMYRFVYEMLAMGNTTLFLDVYPLHVFYRERGLEALKDCLASRKNIYGSGRVSGAVAGRRGNTKVWY